MADSITGWGVALHGRKYHYFTINGRTHCGDYVMGKHIKMAAKEIRKEVCKRCHEKQERIEITLQNNQVRHSVWGRG